MPSDRVLDRYQTALNRLTEAVRTCKLAKAALPSPEAIVHAIEDAQSPAEKASAPPAANCPEVQAAARECHAIWYAMDPKDRDSVVDWKEQYHIAAGDAYTRAK